MSDDFPNQLKDRFEVLSVIGSGGSGTVFKARDKTLNRLLAIKVLKSHRSQSRTYFTRLQREAKTICRLRHPGIIEVYDFILTSEEQPVMVMEFVEGKTLEEIIDENGPMDLMAAINVFIELCQAMSSAHKEGVVHRDLTPRNVVLRTGIDVNVADTPAMKILDFGVARVENIQDKTICKTGWFVGTPFAASPEQARGEETDERSDVYSLGCLMYKTLTGDYPLVGANMIETLQKQIHVEAPALAEKNLEIEYPLKLEDILAKTLAKEPESRYQSMDELEIALVDVLNDLQIASQVQREVNQIEGSARKNWLPLLLVSVAVVFLGTAALIIVFAYKSYKETHRGTVELSQKNQLKWITVVDRLDDVCFEMLDNQPDAKRIKISEGAEFSKPNLKRLLSYQPVMFDLRGITLDDECMQMISKCGSIRSLVLSQSKGITSRGLKYLVSMPRLEILPLSGTGIGDSDIELLTKLKDIRLLYVSKNEKITDQSIPSLLKFQKLQSLSIGYTKIHPTEVKTFLAGLPDLVYLDASGIGVHDEDIPINTKENFAVLLLADNPVTDKLFDRISHLQLSYINVSNCSKISQDAVEDYFLDHVKKRTPLVQTNPADLKNFDVEYQLDPDLYDRSGYDPEKMKPLLIGRQAEKFMGAVGE